MLETKESETLVLYELILDELEVSSEDITALMGYKDQEIPTEIVESIDLGFQLLQDLNEIKGGYVLKSANFIKDNFSISIEDQSFLVGKSIWHYLKKAEQIALFTCTAGKTISHKSKELMSEGLLLEGYTLDVMGSVVVEKAMDVIQAKLADEMALEGKKISNRYSPGYCDWTVKEQHKLFSFLPPKFCGIELTESALMLPVKSVSGFMAIGSDVRYFKYACDTCSSVNCVYRNIKNK